MQITRDERNKNVHCHLFFTVRVKFIGDKLYAPGGFFFSLFVVMISLNNNRGRYNVIKYRLCRCLVVSEYMVIWGACTAHKYLQFFVSHTTPPRTLEIIRCIFSQVVGILNTCMIQVVYSLDKKVFFCVVCLPLLPFQLWGDSVSVSVECNKKNPLQSTPLCHVSPFHDMINDPCFFPLLERR